MDSLADSMPEDNFSGSVTKVRKFICLGKSKRNPVIGSSIGWGDTGQGQGQAMVPITSLISTEAWLPDN